MHQDYRGSTALDVSASGTTTPFPDFTILRGSTRDVSTTWDPPFMCICHASVSITARDGTQQTKSVRVIVIPFRTLAIIGGVLLLLALLAFWMRRRYRASVQREAARLAKPAVS